MNQFDKTILVVHAHPDDTEAFCAGSLALLKARGYRVHIATMTAGGMGGIGTTEGQTIARRRGEAQKAAAVLGADYSCLEGRDGFLYDTPELRTALVSLIRRVKPGIIMTHLPFDYHTDHRATSNMAEAAAMMSTLPNVPCEEEPLKTTPLLYHTAPLGFSDPLGNSITPPHFFLDISSVMEVREKMLACHESQIELMKVMHGMDDFFEEMRKYNRNLGNLAGVKYAECYWQHLGGGFRKDPVLQQELADFLIKPKREEVSE